MTAFAIPAHLQQVSSCPNERDYFALWQLHVAKMDDGFDAARYAGYCADRFAWIFVAGYQSAIRWAFPETQFDGWTAFCVSEDRAKDDPLPGVDWQQDNSGETDLLVSGYKTWVAASAHVSSMVVKAGRGGRAKYLHIPSASQGTTLLHSESPSMLPDLSQGKVKLDRVGVKQSQVLPTARVPGFGQAEVLYIFVAFLAHVQQRHSTDHYAQQAEELLELALKVHAIMNTIYLSTGDTGDTNTESLDEHNDLEVITKDLKGRIKNLLAELSGQIYADDPIWQRDQRLVAMYT